jgi:hypothetical protein
MSILPAPREFSIRILCPFHFGTDGLAESALAEMATTLLAAGAWIKPPGGPGPTYSSEMLRGAEQFLFPPYNAVPGAG